MKTTIKVTDTSGKEYELSFEEGNFTSYEWINMTIDGKTYEVTLSEIIPALIGFDAKRARCSEDE